MIKLNILAVGRLKERYWRDAVEEYAKRIQKYGALRIIETESMPDEGVDDACRLREEEGKPIIKNIRGYAVLMDIGGNAVTSEEFAAMISKKAVEGVSEFTFIIGGSRGVSEEVYRRADARVSFGGVTYPHQLMRVMLAEQLYRALTIINGTGYHK